METTTIIVNIVVSAIAGILLVQVFHSNWWKVVPFWMVALGLGMYIRVC